MLLEALSGSTDPNLVNVKPGDPSFRLCGTVPDILGGWMSMPLISMLFEALHGIVKCTGLDVAKRAGALAREHPAYPPVELLMRRVWGEDDPTVVTSEVIFARSTLIGRDVPYKVFKRWALRDRTPIGPLLRRSLTRDMCCFPCPSMELPSKQGASGVPANSPFMSSLCGLTRSAGGRFRSAWRAQRCLSLSCQAPIMRASFTSMNVPQTWTSVVAIDLKWLALEGAAGIYKTRRGIIAVREEIHAPFWRACYLHQEGDVIYIRAWAIRAPVVPGPPQGVSFAWDKAPMHDYWCPRCAHLNMYGTVLCNGCHLPIFYREWVPGTSQSQIRRGQLTWVGLKAVLPNSWEYTRKRAAGPL